MTKRTLVMLATEYNPLKFKAEGSYMSEKLDGVRALWLPFTRGLEFKDIPWANRARDDRNYICSGLWTRRGKPILAPNWWLDKLFPNIPLDGELFIGRKLFEQTVGTVRKLEPVDSEWEKITYQVFDIPNYLEFFRTGLVREGGTAGDPAYECFFKPEFVDRFPGLREDRFWAPRRFNQVQAMAKDLGWNEVCQLLPQVALPFTRQAAEDAVSEKLSEVTDKDGEGVMLRRAHTIWEPVRHKELVKVKKLKDSEGEIVGYCFGEGKYLGMVGAFRVRWSTPSGPVLFDLSGFTDQERQIKFEFQKLAQSKPGVYCEHPISDEFPLGSSITFRYNEVTTDGKPRFARYYRKYQPL